MLPFLNGERTPDLPLGAGRPGHRQLHSGAPLPRRHGGRDHSLRYGYDAFVRAGMQFDRIVLTGGGSNSAAWRQLVADVRLPVEVPVQAEGAAFGAALQALWSLARSQGNATSISDITARHVTVDPTLRAPGSDRSDAYARAYARFLSHLDAITPLQRG